jgi:hypothetical protein
LKKLLHAGRSGNVYHVDKMDENRWLKRVWEVVTNEEK